MPHNGIITFLLEFLKTSFLKYIVGMDDEKSEQFLITFRYWNQVRLRSIQFIKANLFAYIKCRFDSFYSSSFLL